MLQFILNVLQMIFGNSNSQQAPAPAPVAPPAPAPVPESHEDVDWSNPQAPISKYFTVHNATYLPSWKVHHQPTDQQKANILKIAQKMDLVREMLGSPIIVTAWMRPGQAICPGSEWDGKDYNRYIYETQVWKNLSDEEKAQKHVPASPHKDGEAVDWVLVGKEGVDGCNEVRQLLLPKLEEWQLRMEDIQGNWVHLDIRAVINSRFFKP